MRKNGFKSCFPVRKIRFSLGYEEELLTQTINHITQSIPYPKTRFHFATVTNGNIALLKIFRAKWLGNSCEYPWRYLFRLQAGFKPHTIVYSGSNLNREQMGQVLDWGVTTLNLDSISQLILGELYQQLHPTVKNSCWFTTQYLKWSNWRTSGRLQPS